MAQRFNLQTLPQCGAKNRNGSPCKRKGNLRNARCKLHGGNSTGPVTENGKIVARHNAKKSFPVELASIKANNDYLMKAHTAYSMLHHLMSEQDINWEKVHQIVAQSHIQLEYAKYRIAEFAEPYALAIIQTALDRYYQDTNAPHLRFHAFQGMIMLPMFSRRLTKVQQARVNTWLKNQNLPWKEPNFIRKLNAWMNNKKNMQTN
ncbi:HGGxSTG domain-containing protein [uncultured Photobacterium sp.]|uniref:HGGxSTG domain-containing protein n=1 Tax=uncultured Photobacterium sp. TaxID=173973 RepID=UPI00263165CC|nr:HGGxSTG domain-containing protein [uncultured Photobacterium sp.]